MLVCVALWFMLDGIAGSGRSGAGTLFFDGSGMDRLIAKAVVSAVPMVDFCQDQKARDGFDSSSVKTLDAWCEAVNGVSQESRPEDLVALLRAINTRFGRITDKLFNSGGRSADLSLKLLEAECELRPVLEDAASAVASAAFSQFLVGLILLIPAVLVLRRFR